MKTKILVSNDMPLLSKQFEVILDKGVFDMSGISLAIENETAFDNVIKNCLRAHGIKIIGGERLNKLEQVKLMERLNVPHPKSFFNRDRFSPIKTIEEFDSYYEGDDIFLIKPLLGARGIGVKKLRRKELYDCLINNETEKIFSKEIKELVNEKNLNITPNKDYIIDMIQSGNFLIQNLVNIVKEFRIIYFKGGKAISYERVKKTGSFRGNLSRGATRMDVTNLNFKKYISPLLPKFDLILNELNYPYLSFDVFVDDKGNSGIIEFQMEFDYQGFNPRIVVDSLEQAINLCLN